MTCGECGNVTAPGAGFPNHVYCKRFLLHMEKREDASRCRDFIPKPITNADRIRAMTDEELAEWIYSVQDEDALRKANFLLPLSKEWWLDWLKSEVSANG